MVDDEISSRASMTSLEVGTDMAENWGQFHLYPYNRLVRNHTVEVVKPGDQVYLGDLLDHVTKAGNNALFTL